MDVFAQDVELSHMIIVRILVSFILGMIIGVERGITHKSIGFRTLSLVCVGSAGFTIVSIYGFDAMDKSRVAAQIVTGIGFLGAGAIMHTGYVTRGLTTAAALWATAAIGMACGTGMFVLAFILTLMTLVSLWVLKPVKKKLDHLVDSNGGAEKKKQKESIVEEGDE